MNILDLTKKLVSINTINPPGNEEICAKFLGKILEDNNFETNYYRIGECRSSLVARLGGGKKKKSICFTGHIDTVPLGATEWKTNPLIPETDGDLLYGRGTSDMKSGVAAFVMAAIKMSKHLKNSAGIELVITASEETGCQGAFDLAKIKGALGRVGAMIVGEPTSNFPYIGHKGALWMNLITKGITAHGSMPEKGSNAIYKASKIISLLEKYKFKNCRHSMMGQATLNVGTIKGGLNINSVPDEAEIGVDIRTVPTSLHSEIKSDFNRIFGKEVEIETILDVPSVYTSPENDWVQDIFKIVEEFTKIKPKPSTATYFTDAAALNPAYKIVPTIILGPGSPEMAHQTDEYCSINKTELSVDLYEEIIKKWCEF